MNNFDHPTAIHLDSGGYERDCVVTVERDDRVMFETDRESKHPTRFLSDTRVCNGPEPSEIAASSVAFTSVTEMGR